MDTIIITLTVLYCDSIHPIQVQVTVPKGCDTVEVIYENTRKHFEFENIFNYIND